MKRTILCALLLVLMVFFTSKSAGVAAPGRQVVQLMDTTIAAASSSMHVTMNYLLWLPTGYNTYPDSLWPVIFWHHGAGEAKTYKTAPADSIIIKTITTAWSIPKALQTPASYPFIADRFIVVSPWVTEGNQSIIADTLINLYEYVFKHYRCNTKRVAVAGYCYGSSVAWAVAAKRPDIPASMNLFTFGGPLARVDLANVPQIARIPTRIYHNAGDPTITWLETKVIYDNIMKCPDRAADNDYILWLADDHFSWREEEFRPRFYNWILAHTKDNLVKVSTTDPAQNSGIALYSDAINSMVTPSAQGNAFSETSKEASEGSKSLEFKFSVSAPRVSFEALNGVVACTLKTSRSIDISGWKNLRMALKRNSVDRTFHRFTLALQDVDGHLLVYGNRWWPSQAAVTVDTEWTDVSIPGDLFVHDVVISNDKDTLPFDERRVTGILFFMIGAPADTGSIFMDDIRFIGAGGNSIVARRETGRIAQDRSMMQPASGTKFYSLAGQLMPAEKTFTSSDVVFVNEKRMIKRLIKEKR